MDVLAAARAFVSVSARGGFTDGAAALRIPQSVASRRIAALERQVGSPLFDRSRRGAALTPAGERLLPVARRLVELGDEFLLVAEQGRRRTVRIAVPRTSTAALARLALAGRAHGLVIECVEGEPAGRARMLEDRAVVLAVLPAAAAGSAGWSAPLGAAGRTTGGPRAIRLSSLRIGRGDRRRPPVLHLLPEDDAPAVRDLVMQARDDAGLRADQVVLAPTATAALAAALDSDDRILCTAVEAAEWGLHWRPLIDPEVRRAFSLVGDAESARLLRGPALDRAMAEALGMGGTEGAA